MRAASMRVLGGLLLIVAVAGCANAPVAQRGGPPSTSASAPPSSPSSGPGPSSSSPAPSGTVAPGIQVPGVRVPDAQLDLSAAGQAAPSSVWTSDGGRTLHIVGGERACSTLHADVLEQGPRDVHIGIATTLLHTLTACPMQVARQTVTVTLDAPLGSREVVFVAERH